jgi:hypothetical protein
MFSLHFHHEHKNVSIVYTHKLCKNCLHRWTFTSLTSKFYKFTIDLAPNSIFLYFGAKSSLSPNWFHLFQFCSSLEILTPLCIELRIVVMKFCDFIDCFNIFLLKEGGTNMDVPIQFSFVYFLKPKIVNIGGW